MSAYPFASNEKVEETLDVLGTRNIATTQQTLLQQILVACAVNGGTPTTPPTLAPTLTAIANFGSSTAILSWTPSDNTSSPGFAYKIENNINSAGWNLVTNTTNLSYSYATEGGATGTFAFRVTPYNEAGEGPVSNEASVILPGEYDGPTLLGPNGTTDPQFVYANFTLTWSEIAAAVSYRLYGSATDSGYTLWEGDITGTSLAIDFSAAFGTNWWYVVAVDGEGVSSFQSNHLECTPVI